MCVAAPLTLSSALLPIVSKVVYGSRRAPLRVRSTTSRPLLLYGCGRPMPSTCLLQPLRSTPIYTSSQGSSSKAHPLDEAALSGPLLNVFQRQEEHPFTSKVGFVIPAPFNGF